MGAKPQSIQELIHSIQRAIRSLQECEQGAVAPVITRNSMTGLLNFVPQLEIPNRTLEESLALEQQTLMGEDLARLGISL